MPTLSVAAVVTSKTANSSAFIANGIMATFNVFFNAWHVNWLERIFAIVIAAGGLSSVISWIAGPSRGLSNAVSTGLVPPIFQRKNKHEMHVGILIPQALIVTFVSLIYVFVPNVDSVFVFLIDSATSLYIAMYLFMFAAAIVLRRKRPDVPRAYHAPALIPLCVLAIISVSFGLVLAFIPSVGNTIFVGYYSWMFGLIFVLLALPPFIFYTVKKPDWDLRSKEEKAAEQAEFGDAKK